MLWAIVSSIFVIYLYRQLNAASDSAAVRGENSISALDAELAKLNDRISALETAASGKARETSP
jgi:hypothetical protein